MIPSSSARFLLCRPHVYVIRFQLTVAGRAGSCLCCEDFWRPWSVQRRTSCYFMWIVRQITASAPAPAPASEPALTSASAGAHGSHGASEHLGGGPGIPIPCRAEGGMLKQLRRCDSAQLQVRDGALRMARLLAQRREENCTRCCSVMATVWAASDKLWIQTTTTFTCVQKISFDFFSRHCMGKSPVISCTGEVALVPGPVRLGQPLVD